MKRNKGFSLIEFMVVVALIGVLSIFLYTPKTSRWNTEVSAAQSKIVSSLKYYQKKSMRDGYKYYVRLNQNLGQNIFEMDAYIDKNITSRQSSCTSSNDANFEERRLFDSLKNIRVVGCQAGGKACRNASSTNMGICFFPNGSAAATQNKKEWYIFHAAGDNTAHAKNAYKFVVWKTTSFIETFACKGGAQYANISSSNLSCSTNWIEE